jgi:hypothetical protein
MLPAMSLLLPDKQLWLRSLNDLSEMIAHLRVMRLTRRTTRRAKRGKARSVGDLDEKSCSGFEIMALIAFGSLGKNAMYSWQEIFGRQVQVCCDSLFLSVQSLYYPLCLVGQATWR